MATSIASQLQSLKTHLQIESEPLKRPLTRPSILFDPKEAADIDVETIFNTALAGLEILISIDQRFTNYKSDLFSHKSRELDRELMGIDENKRIDTSITSYLRLLSGHLHSSASLKTLEYLIRRYKIHVYNTEELILCALPYHDTHAFVRIVQLIDMGNSKWKFLGGVKDKGAPAPRNLIVQQCIRDRGILEVLCNYGSPNKKSQPSIPVISFCTAVIVEVVGSVTTIDSDVVKRILPFIASALKPDSKVCSDHKAGALMIVGLLANKVSLSPKLVKSLIRSVAEVAREDAKESTDLQWLRSSLMTLINLVQFQSADLFPKKALDVLKEIRDFAGILSGLYNEFNIDKFISILLDSLVEYSSSDDLCRLALVSIVETIPVKDVVETLVSKVLMFCMKLSQRSSNSSSPESGTWAKDILVAINKGYPSELRMAVRKFLENCKVQPKKGESTFEILCKTLDGNVDFTNGISDSKIWFALNHPKAEVRRATLSGLNSSGILKTKAVDSQRLVTVQDAILRQLHDDDLTVIKMALSLDGLSELISSHDLLEALHNVLQRCVSILMSKSSDDTTLAGDVIVSCLARMTSSFSAQIDCSRKLATLIFPLLIILPKTHRLNLKVLALARQLKWPFFHNIDGASDSELKLQPESISALNMENINSMADILLMHPEDHVPWIIPSCKEFKLSKTIFFMILMQSFQSPKFTSCRLKAFYGTFFPILATEWNAIESGDFYVEFKKEMLHWDCNRFEGQLVDTNLEALNANILICLFWRLLEAFNALATAEVLSGDNGLLLRELFVFFASSKLSSAFKEHLHYLVEKCSSSPARFLSSFFAEEGIPTDVQVESLHCYSHLCSQSDDRVLGQLIAEFPSVLVPLSSDDQETRSAAMVCIERLYALQKRGISCQRKGGNAVQSDFLYDLMDLLIQQKCLILSDKKFLPSLLTTSLSSSSHSLLVHTDINQRFDQSKKTEIRDFILDSVPVLSAYGKFVIISLLKGLGNAIIRNDIESLLNVLLERRSKYSYKQDKSFHKLSRIEVQILCLLLEICATPPSPADGCVLEVHLLKALQLDGLSQDDSAVVQPCISVLQVLNCQLYSGLKTEIQELLFRELVSLFHNANGDIQNVSRETLLRLNITCSTVVQTLDFLYTSGAQELLSTQAKKKRKSTDHKKSSLNHDGVCRKENTFSFISSLVDILLLKKNIVNRDSLVGPLFELLGKLLSDQLVLHSSFLDEKSMQPSSTISQATSTSVYYIQQTLLLILEDICVSLKNNIPVKDDIVNSFNVKMLIECARSTTEGVTRNHVFALLSSIAKVMPEKIVDHILEILTVAGESAVTQIDGHSQRVFEGLVSALIPCWLSKRDSTDELLQVFIHIMPEVAEHRRLSIVRYLLRTLGEQSNLASVVSLLFHFLVLRSGVFSDIAGAQGSDGFRSLTEREWEYVFAKQICDQYSCMIWLPSLVTLLQRIGVGKLSEKSCTEMLLSIQLIAHKLQDPEFAFKLKSGDDSEKIQMTLEELMEQVVSLSLIVDAKRKKIPVATRKYLKEVMYVVLKTITMDMIPSAYFESIIRLLEHADREMQKKALRLLCETMKGHDTSPKNKVKRSSLNSSGRWLDVDDKALQSLEKLCVRIVQIVDDSIDDLNTSLKLGAVSALDILAQRFPSNYSIFSISLTSVVRSIMSPDLTLSSSCLKTTGALINVIGTRALAELPHIMKNVLKRSHEVSSSSTSKESLMLSILFTLEAVVDKLGGFLNPYLGDIIELVVLCPEYTSESDPKLKLRADTVRRLISEKIPVRLSLPSLLKVYPSAVISGDSSLGIAFEMLTSLIGTMDKASVSGYHAQIFDMCLLALDLRRQRPASVQDIDVVERSVLNAMVSLTMKLTESMFRPLFVKTIEWAESDVEERGSTNIDRAISFYGLVNQLVEKHRSLFVPYFKHLVEGCVRYLADTDMAKSTLRRKKKAKIEKESGKDKEDSALLLGNWHLRALILSTLHSCFLYDTGSLKFLDSTNFQVLLKPIVSQLVAEPPSSLKEHSHIPSEKEVDDLLVSCIGQMAVTAGSDLLWKPLNHEVLMQTRSEKLRCRILGLRIIKYLVEHLKEEYLVLLPETIPFLGELLEDIEQPVKSLAQDILRDMESMSGESLAQYL